MGVGMRSIRAEAFHQSVVPRSIVLRFCLEQEGCALSTGPHAQFRRMRFYITRA
jgi:hypothetical protein